MNAQHTPGPWQASEYYNEGVEVTDARGFVIVEAKHIPILLGWHDKLGIGHWADKPGQSYIELTPEEQAANAHLIAAAPDLLESLRGLYAAMACYESTPEEMLALEYARSAIAKATGVAA